MERLQSRDLVSLRIENSVAIATINNPPVNALSRPLVSDLVSVLTEFAGNAEAKALVLTANGKIFVAGADIREIESITRGERSPELNYLNELLHQIEQSPKPIVMAMNGSALGIGLELAMAGHYRVLEVRAQVGQPEVKLGLIPGAGGTQRLPRLAGFETALELCVFGESISAKEALAAGIVDELSVGDPLPAAMAAALKIQSPRRSSEIASPPLRPGILSEYRDEALAVLPQQAAPIQAILAIEAAQGPFDKGLAVETALFQAQLQHTQARAMVHLFFASREISRIPGLPPETKAAVEGDYTLLPSDPPNANLLLRSGGGCLYHLPLGPDGPVAEIASSSETSSMETTPECLATALAIARQQGKLAIYVRNTPGLIVRRLSEAYSPTCDSAALARAAQELLDEGVALRASDLDLVCVRGLGFPVYLGGPLHWSKYNL